jgi:hypothetical protein
MTRVTTKNIRNVMKKNMKKALSKTSMKAIAFSLLFLLSGIEASILVTSSSCGTKIRGSYVTHPAGG